jgi:hypothetical protein
MGVAFDAVGLRAESFEVGEDGINGLVFGGIVQRQMTGDASAFLMAARRWLWHGNPPHSHSSLPSNVC